MHFELINTIKKKFNHRNLSEVFKASTLVRYQSLYYKDSHSFILDTKESAFVHALSASTLALTVAQGCMAGKLDKCTCHQRKQQISFPAEIVDRDNASHVNELVSCKGILNVGQEFAKEFFNAGIRMRAKTERHKLEMATQKHNVNLGLKV